MSIQRYRSHSECRQIPNLGLQHGSRMDKDDAGGYVRYVDHLASVARYQELERAARERVAWGHSATCGKALVDAACDCGYDALINALQALSETPGAGTTK